MIEHGRRQAGSARPGFRGLRAAAWACAAWSCILAAAGQAAEDWLTSYENALRAAREQHKPVLTVFTGSDWCPHCRTLEEQVLHTDTFRAWAEGRVVLLMIDLPKQGISAEERAVRSRVCIAHGVRTFPSVALIDPAGERITVQTGYMGQTADAWVAAMDGHLESWDPETPPAVASREDPAMRLTSGNGPPRR